MTTDDQSNASGKWYPEIEILIGHTTKVCEMHGANAVPPEFDLARVKAACARAEELRSLTPIEAAPIIAEIQEEIELPPNVGDEDHMLRSELYHVMATKLSLSKLENNLPDGEIAHGQQNISASENAEELKEMLGKVTSLLETIEAQTGQTIGPIPDYVEAKQDWQARKEELVKIAVDGGSVTIAGPGMSVPAITAIAELLYMHLKPMIEMNVRLLKWYASELMRRSKDMLDKTIDSAARVTREAIQTIAKTALSLSQKILSFIQQLRKDDVEKNLEVFDHEDAVDISIGLPVDTERQEAFCVSINEDYITISSTHDGELVDAPLALVTKSDLMGEVGYEAENLSTQKDSHSHLSYPITEWVVQDTTEAMHVLQNIAGDNLERLRQAREYYYAVPTGRQNHDVHIELLRRMYGHGLIEIEKSRVLAIGLSNRKDTDLYLHTCINEEGGQTHILKGAVVQSSQSLPFGATKFDESFQENYKTKTGSSITLKQAASLRAKMLEEVMLRPGVEKSRYRIDGETQEFITPQEYVEAVTDTLREWMETIVRYLNDYQSLDPIEPVTKLYVSGYMFGIHALREKFASMTHYPVEVVYDEKSLVQYGLHIYALKQKKLPMGNNREMMPTIRKPYSN